MERTTLLLCPQKYLSPSDDKEFTLSKTNKTETHLKRESWYYLKPVTAILEIVNGILPLHSINNQETSFRIPSYPNPLSPDKCSPFPHVLEWAPCSHVLHGEKDSGPAKAWSFYLPYQSGWEAKLKLQTRIIIDLATLWRGRGSCSAENETHQEVMWR